MDKNQNMDWNEPLNKIITRFKKITPEGNLFYWGHLVTLGLAGTFTLALGILPSFGLLFGDFLTTLGDETSSVALITSCFFSSFSFAGLFSNTLIKKTSCRFIGLTGGTLFFIGSVLTIFVNTVSELLISFSICQGVGFGLIIPVAYNTFNSYFVHRRVLMTSIVQICIGFGAMLYPILIQKLMHFYGFRGCLMIIAALNSHAILGMLMMHPVEWHLKTVKACAPLAQLLQKTNSKEVITLIKEEKKPTRSLRQSLISNQILRDEDYFSTRRESCISSLGNWTGPIVISDCSDREDCPVKKWQVLIDFLDLNLLKDPIYVNIALGISLAHFSDATFFIFQPLYLFTLEYSKQDISYIIAFGATADFTSRIILAASSIYIEVKARNVYLAGALFTVFARLAFQCVHNFYGILIVTGILGFLRAWMYVPLPLVFSEYLPKERFPSGYGLFMFLQGNIMFLIGPVVGYIRDVTKSYDVSFYCLSCVMAFCVIPWIVEIIYLQHRVNQEEQICDKLDHS